MNLSPDTIIIDKAREIASCTPAGGTFPNGTFARRGAEDPDNRGRLAETFEDFNEAEFYDETQELFVLGIWAFGFLCVTAGYIAGPHVLQLLFILFDWLAAAP